MLQGVLPIRKAQIPVDMFAGVTLAALALPEVLGYAKIAGTPVITGLYTMLVPMILYAIFGSSRHLVVSADSATAAILSATLAGVAGSLKALVFQLASLTDVHWTMSGDVLLMTLLGGLGTVFGPVVGAFVVIAMQNYLAPFGQWVLVIQGAIFVVCVLIFRRGIVGELAQLLHVRL